MKQKHKDAMIAMGIKIAALEQLLKNHGQAHMAQDILPQFTLLSKQVDMHLHRLTDHDESIEALSETVDQLSTCKCEAGNQMLKRISELEESNRVFLKSIPDIEILKTQIAGILKDNTRAYAVHHKEAFDAVYAKMKEQRGDYHDHIAQLVRENKAAHNKFVSQLAGLEIRLSRAQDMIAEMHKDGFIPVKKPSGRPKKAQ